MKIAILGGGFAGLSSAYYLTRKGHSVTIFEKDQYLGGLAQGYKKQNWRWSLEYAVHHLFTNDHDIQRLAHDTGFTGIFFTTPSTASLYKQGNNYRIIPVDTPQDFLRLPLLPLGTKLRAAAVLAFLKSSPFLKLYEKYSAEAFLRKTMGDQAWEVLFAELFRKKFGKYAGNILASFIWARIKKRSRKLGYITGGFSAFVTHLEEVLKSANVLIHLSCSVKEIKSVREGFKLVTDREGEEKYDVVISTLPTPILLRVGSELLPKSYLADLEQISYEHAISAVFELKKPYLKDTYWLNNCVEDSPIMGVFEHTNFVSKKHYGGNHILYVGNYVAREDSLLKMSEGELVRHYTHNLKRLNADFSKKDIVSTNIFKGPFAQPIFDKTFIKVKPDFITPVKNLLIANLDMTYPYDRGTNYAVALGKKVAELI